MEKGSHHSESSREAMSEARAAVAKSSRSPLAAAIRRRNTFRSLSQYYAYRVVQLGISRAMFFAYLSGEAPGPRRLQDRISDDFPELKGKRIFPAGIAK